MARATTPAGAALTEGTDRQAPEAIRWSDLEPPLLARAEQLAREAEADEWWSWPEAVAWVGERDLRNIATMRLCAELWKDRDDLQFDVALGAEWKLAPTYCTGAPTAEIDLQRAIERGAINTLGRETFDGPLRKLKARNWIGGKVVFNDTVSLVSAASSQREWACDLAMSRSDLWAAFPPNQANKTSKVQARHSTAAAEHECETWLLGQFQADPNKQRTKSSFQSGALSRFEGRLSQRGFIRVWDKLAPGADRSRAGRKS